MNCYLLLPQSPLFLYLSYQAPHAPRQAPKHYIDMYEGQYDDENQTVIAGTLQHGLVPRKLSKFYLKFINHLGIFEHKIL